MEYWHQERILDLVENQSSRHLASEPHIRIQVINIPWTVSRELYGPFHGELLIIVLRGTCVIKTESTRQELKAGDQALLIAGEKFNVSPSDEASSVVVQMIWTPGPNPCEVCGLWQKQ